MMRQLLAAALCLGWFSVYAACEEPPQKITTNTVLDAQCVYKGDYIITASNVSLDCRGATLDGEGTRRFGVRVDSQGSPLQNVTIKNCVIKNFGINGIWIGWGKPDAEKAAMGSRDFIYARTPQKTTIDHVAIDGSGRVGLYVDDYVKDTKITDSTVTGSAGTGVYIEHSSMRTHIVSSSFSNNGLGKREQIAIDSSSENVIENSEFDTNGVGGVFLYKNCYERAASDSASVPRWMPSNNNIIRKNLFTGTGTAVWVASRQSRNLKGFECGDPPIKPGLFIYKDYAQYNTVTSNKFLGSGVAVNVEDSFNTVSTNDFTQFDGVNVRVGAKYLNEVLGQPISGISLTGNRWSARAGRPVDIHSNARVDQTP